MITAGIIAEYNPFHDGHRYHIEKTREITGADYVIAVMSGDYVQRGEPACTDKYMRTRMALLGGADLVIELPVVYAAASAEAFARAGVSLLDSLGCVDYLSFGSEWASIADYEGYVRILSREPSAYQELLLKHLREGITFPRARSLALEALMGQRSMGDGQAFPKEAQESMGDTRICSKEALGFSRSAQAFLKEPNHILGLEYMKALERLGSSIKPVAIIRRGSAYHEQELGENLPSAAAIRQALLDIEKEQLSGRALIKGETGQGSDLVTRLLQALGNNGELLFNHILSGESVLWEDLMPLLDYAVLMRQESADLKNREGQQDRFISDSQWDLHRRICRQYQPNLTFDQILERLHTKNRTDTALKRALLHILLQIEPPPEFAVPYARVLGFRKQAAPLIKKIREKSSIPIIQRLSQGKKYYGSIPYFELMYQADLRASDLYEQTAARKAGRRPVNELTRQQVIL